MITEQRREFQTLPETENVNSSEKEKGTFLSDLQSRAALFVLERKNSVRAEELVIDLFSDSEEQDKDPKSAGHGNRKRKAEDNLQNPDNKRKGRTSGKLSGTNNVSSAEEISDISTFRQKSTSYIELTSSDSDSDSDSDRFPSHSSCSTPGRDSNHGTNNGDLETRRSRTGSESRRSRSYSSSSRSRNASSRSSTYHDDVSAHSVRVL